MQRRDFLGRLSAAGASAAAPGTSVAAQAGPIAIVVPEDGGTPRSPGRIVRLGEREFRVLASVEEGKSLLTHAVSRIDLLVSNSGPETEVTLHLDLSADGQRTNLDSRPEGGMPKRDYVYIQPQGEAWRRVDGST